MTMKKKLWIPLIAILLFSAADSYAQRWKLQRYEVDIALSGVGFHGDIGLANRPFENMFNGFRPSLSLMPRFKITEKIGVAMELGYAAVFVVGGAAYCAALLCMPRRPAG